jgi:hypothetical protein
MKEDHNSHDFAQAQATATTFLLAGTGWQLGMLTSQQRTAKIVNLTEHRYNIHAELQQEWVWRPRVDPIYHIP